MNQPFQEIQGLKAFQVSLDNLSLSFTSYSVSAHIAGKHSGKSNQKVHCAHCFSVFAGLCHLVQLSNKTPLYTKSPGPATLLHYSHLYLSFKILCCTLMKNSDSFYIKKKENWERQDCKRIFVGVYSYLPLKFAPFC